MYGKRLKLCSGALIALLAGCSGENSSVAVDNGGVNNGNGNPGGAGMGYSFNAPSVNSRQTYAVTTIDNSRNTIHQTEQDTTLAVNADGSYVFLHNDPTGDAITVNGTNYTVIPETYTESSSGQHLSFTYTAADGSTAACTFSPHGPGPNFPLTAGQTWTSDYTFACGGNAPVSYTQKGTVAGIESVTVPAGTFTAIKLQSTLTWTDAEGTTHTQSITTWRDTATDIVVKRVTDISYSGVLPANGYPVSITATLSSRS